MAPSEWHQSTLGEVAMLVMGQAPPSTVVHEGLGGGLPFIQGNAEFGTRFPAPKKSCSSPSKLAEEGDILISVRAPVGALNRARSRLAIGRGLAAIRLQGLHPDFAWFALQFSVGGLSRLSQGSTFEAINKDALSTLSLPCPPIGEQRKIAAILSSVDEAIEATQAVIDQLQVVKKAMMAELLTRGLPGRHPQFKQTEIGEVPESWSVVPLGDLCRHVSDGPHFSPTYVSQDEGVPFLSARNVTEDAWQLADAKYVSRADHEEFCKRARPEPNDVLYTKGGTTGVARVNDLPFEFSIWVHIALLKTRPEAVDSRFLATALNGAHCYRQSRLFTHGTSNQDLGLTRMVKILVPLPPLPEQREIAMCKQNFSSRLEAEREYCDGLKSLKAGLMSVLLTGELRVTTDPEPT